MPIFKAFLRVLCTVRFTVLGVFLIINSSFAVDCNDGYRTSCLPILDAQITNTTRTAYAAKPLDESADQTDGDATAETYGLSSTGEWGVSFEMGAFVGESTCSVAYTEIVYQTGTPTDTPGHYCWCKATAFVPSDTEGMTCVSTTGPWISLGTINQSIDDCKSQCATKCTTLNPVSGVIAGKDSGFWDSLTEYDNDVCVPYTYKISYVMNDGQFPVIANVNNFYQITDDTISIPNPIDRVGYTFDGWCDNAELTQNCQINKTIPTGSYGDKTFYAKWTFVGCPEGYYFYEVDHLSSLDTSVDGTSHGQNSISGTNYNSSVSDLTATNGYGRGTWATNFDYGRIYGAARCSSRSGNTHSNMWNGLVSDWS
ncbi:MAG: InlB B-repeat-containing protein, partial [Alphaproteobacteria bacterium]|nr:InlB B-repeat-containing protein [Alphaproteobacteria bacterium]